MARDEGEGDGKISGKQEAFNRRFIKKLEEQDTEIARLQQIDFRMNDTLVSKPYKYIDKYRKELESEQNSIRKIIKDNNEKYITKITQTDQKVAKVLTDTETLLDQYRKKIGDIGKNLESTKRFREKIDTSVNGF